MSRRERGRPDRTRPPSRDDRRRQHQRHQHAIEIERLCRGVVRYSRHGFPPGTVVIVRHAGHHPAIVLSASDDGLTVRPCTSTPNPAWVVDWLVDHEAAGLSKHTAIQRRTVFIDRTDVLGICGYLSDKDSGALA